MNERQNQVAATGTAAESSAQRSAAASPSPRPRLQISLALMLLLMVVFAVISASLFYASRVPVVRQEISMLLYGEVRDGGEDAGRLAHRAFIMFTFASPLILACLLSLGVSLVQRFDRGST